MNNKYVSFPTGIPAMVGSSNMHSRVMASQRIIDAHRGGGGVRGEGGRGMKQHPTGKFIKNLVIKMQ